MGLNGQEEFIINFTRLVRPKLLVKFGLSQCKLFNKLTPYAEKSIGVDLQPDAGNFMKKSLDTCFINCTTQEFAKVLETKPLQINMLFIDGANFKEPEPKDFREFLPFIAPFGFILLQDPQPVKTERVKAESYNIMKTPVSPGLTILRKR